MSTLESIQQTIGADLERLHALIRSQLMSDNQLTQSVIDNYLRVKGKLIRPIIVILCSRLFGPVSDRVISAAASVELLHNASLIHDDVVDQADTRRGRPTVNATWDNHIAVLVGDFFVSSAMQQAISTGDVRIIDALCHLGKLLSLGELEQIYNARYHNLSEEAYFKTINYKTASLFVTCARMGCYAQGVDDERTRVLCDFAETLGLCFQIRDDIFDYFDDADGHVGKPTGNDLREGKITLPLLHVLLDTSAPGHEHMYSLAMSEQLDDSQIALLMAYARDNGGIDYAYDVMRSMRDRACRLLDIFGDKAEAASLRSLFDYIITRRH